MRPSCAAADVLAAQLRRLEDFLGSLRHPPAVVTLARSVDGYARIFDVADFEAATMEMLGRVFGLPARGDDGAPCVRRAPGTAPLAALLELRAAVLQT